MLSVRESFSTCRTLETEVLFGPMCMLVALFSRACWTEAGACFALAVTQVICIRHDARKIFKPIRLCPHLVDDHESRQSAHQSSLRRILPRIRVSREGRARAQILF